MPENRERPLETNLPDETNKLLHSYFNAFSNLYGIIPLYRAFRIIQKQNPELKLTEEQFLNFVSQVEQEECYYTIAGAEEIYEGIEQPTPPLKRELIAEHLYVVDDFESYAELKEQQGDKPFYIPDKEELLKYQDEFYIEDTREALELGDFLRGKMKLKHADDIVSDLQLTARMGDMDLQLVISEVQRMEGKRCFSSMEQVNDFCQYYIAMYNHTHIPSNRGFTPVELREKMGGGMPASVEFSPSISQMPQTGRINMGSLPYGTAHAGISKPLKEKQKKPGRNDPCPCGSGKKYKKCCGK